MAGGGRGGLAAWRQAKPHCGQIALEWSISITDSPAFALLALTLIPWALGVVMFLGYPQKKIGYWLGIVAAVVGGMFSFLLWFAFNAI